MKSSDQLMRYGVPSTLAEKAEAKGLSLTKIRGLSKNDLTAKFELTVEEVDELKTCVARQPIGRAELELLLEHSNHTCCVCKGAKGGGIVVHHIEPYEVSQDNTYPNLAVLCPNDHDRAHRPGGLTLGLTADQVRQAKSKWERDVEVANVQAAAKVIDVDAEAIDYVNIMRIEEMCLRLLGRIPQTSLSSSLRRAKILGTGFRFDERYVRENISNGSYMFDYGNAGETHHYRRLMEELTKKVQFEDLSEAARSGIRRLTALEGRYVFFIGAVDSKRPAMPITPASAPLVLRHKARGVAITWDGNPNYLMSMSSIGRLGRRNRYIIYGRVGSVLRSNAKNVVEVSVSPLLIAQPSVDFVRTVPAIAARHRRRIIQI